LNGCYRAGNPSLCGLIERNESGVITQLLDIDTNIGSTRTEGADADIAYQFPSTPVGDFNADWRTTYTRDFTQTIANLGSASAKPIVTDRIATETVSPPRGFPRFKSNLRLNWTYRNWSADLTARFISAITEPCSDSYDGTPLSLTNLGLCSNPDFKGNSKSRNHLGATTYFDLQASYDWSVIDTTFTVGVRNLLDRPPPIAHSVSNNFDPTLYNIPGRFPYVRISTSFE
jgi:iron complex outermembrane receptor protein